MEEQQPKKTFADYKEAFATSIIAEIAQGIKTGKAPFFKDISAKELQENRAYNALNGVPLDGMNSLKADLKCAQFEYNKNVWISLEDAQKMAQKGKEGYEKTKEEIDTIKAQFRAEMEAIKEARAKGIEPETQTNWRNKTISIQYIQIKKAEFVYKKDANGNKIPLLDSNNNQRIGANGQPLYEYELDMTKPYVDSQGKTQYQAKVEFVSIEPRFRTEILYNIDEFKTIDLSKIKPLNETIQRKHQFKHAQEWEKQNNGNTLLVLNDIEKKLKPQTADQIKAYMKAQNNGTDYNVPTRLNAIQREEVAQITKDLIAKYEQDKADIALYASTDNEHKKTNTQTMGKQEKTAKFAKSKQPETKKQSRSR
ncbi:DUF1738 domain-containing protein [Helicobacter jaachi]|uniref:DUF1738 domain-containing protein n=1 Tax=Helicobacter jaachi TaxID=1677920 RepID=A0A4V6I2A8_9HELI|nr:ArdC-like ssDNA-binding domain-containing protein [Helicobacter jaachi]TLD95392.1 DUF1738 domain-containing protein [Helicobacter jaachi]